MSDARTDFFASGAKSTKSPAAPDARGAFFDDPDSFIQPNTAQAAQAPPSVDYSKPYAYYTPEAQRAVGGNGDLTPLKEVAPGVNQGVAQLLGLPATTLVDAANLTSAGMGYLQSKITGNAPSPIFDPVDPASVPLTGAWNEQMLNASPLGDVTSVRNPDSAAARVVHAAAAGVPGGVVGGMPNASMALSGAAGGVAGEVAGELGADPATQSVASLMAGALAGRPSAPREKVSPQAVDEVAQAQQKLNAGMSKQSMGAAAAAPDIRALSPDLQQAVVKAVKDTGGAINPEVLIRHVQDDALPVKVHLTDGQASGDVNAISDEMNNRGRHPELAERFNSQNKALVANLDAFREQAGPDVFSTNHVEHADTIIGRYQAIDDARSADIGAKYQALRDAAGGDFPVDAKALLTNTQKALRAELKQHDAPPSVMKTLEELASADSMTFEEFEHLRTNLSNIQRQNQDGNVRHAAGIIRKEMEALPLKGGAADLKPLADTARAAAKERFDALKADPAYKAAVEGSTPPDKFVQKFIVGGTREGAATLNKAMQGDETALQTIKVATLDHLRKAAGIDASGNGNFSQAGYNKALAGLEPKIGSLLDQKTVEHARTLGDVSRYVQQQPRGSYVNNSNTFVAAAKQYGKNVAEDLGNTVVPGIRIGTKVRETIEHKSEKARVQKSLAPGAGLSRLSELTKLKEPK